jgi:hypothetical protein
MLQPIIIALSRVKLPPWAGLLNQVSNTFC